MKKNHLRVAILVNLFLCLIFLFSFSACSGSQTSIISTPMVTNGTLTTHPTTTTPVVSSSPSITSGTTKPSQATEKRYGGTLRFITPFSLTIFGSPSEMSTMMGWNHQPCFEYLMLMDTAGNPLPNIIESWDISSDGKIITLHVRKGIKFHDGTDCNAQAVKYNLENYTSNNARPAEYAAITKYEVIDDYTLRLSFNNFMASFFNTLALNNGGLVASPKALQTETTPANMAKDHMVGTGPFIFDSWQRDQFIKFKKNPNYWQPGKPYLDEFEIIQIADPMTALAYFKSGEGQVLYRISPSIGADLKKQGYQTVISEIAPVHFLAPDGKNADSPFNNKLVREAVEYAIDKKAIADTIGHGFYPVAYQMANKIDANYNPDIVPREYNVAKAKQLLAQAGYPSGFNTTLLAMTSDNRDVIVAIKAYLDQVGIKATIDIAEQARFFSMTQKGGGWKGLVYLSLGIQIQNFSRRFGTGGLAYASIYLPEGWQAKLDATLSQVDTVARNNQFKELTKILADEAVVIPLWFQPDITALADEVHDLDWGKGFAPFYYKPANVWLSK